MLHAHPSISPPHPLWPSRSPSRLPASHSPISRCGNSTRLSVWSLAPQNRCSGWIDPSSIRGAALSLSDMYVERPASLLVLLTATQAHRVIWMPDRGDPLARAQEGRKGRGGDLQRRRGGVGYRHREVMSEELEREGTHSTARTLFRVIRAMILYDNPYIT